MQSKGKLYIVSTPIGNLNDITFRAVDILKGSHLIAAEDTRKSKILLNHYQIHTKMISYHEHNSYKKIDAIIDALNKGNNISLISDAGTPGISDPAYRLIRQAIKNKLSVVPIPGPSAFLTAVSTSGLPTDSFLFEGFLPIKKGREKKLKMLSLLDATVILYESPKRIKRTLEDVLNIFGDRPTVVCKELTKIHESFFRGNLSQVISDIKNANTKGEFVILIGKNDPNVYF